MVWLQMDLEQSGQTIDSFLDVSDVVEVTTRPPVTSTPQKKKSEQKQCLCPECGKTYKHQRTLRNHRLFHHTEGGGPRVTCGMCKKTFTRSADLQSHVNKQHIGQKPFDCSKCHKKCACKRNANPNRHTCVQITKYACDVCGKEYKHKSTLKAHTNTHTHTLAHSCPRCFYPFMYRTQLLRHSKKCVA